MKYFFICLFALSPFPALGDGSPQGGSDVGGGMGVVCKDVNGTIASVELLDLWEARVIYGRTINPSNKPAHRQIDLALDQLKNSIYAAEYCVGQSCPGGTSGPEALRLMLQFDTDLLLAPDAPPVRRLRGARLKKTEDAFEVVTPSDCEIAQLVRFMDTPTRGGFILIDQDLVDKMDATNVAALYVHEALYRHLRSYGEKSSLRTRRAVGLAFSGHAFVPLESYLPANYYSCADSRNRIFLYETSIEDYTGKERLAATFQIEKVAGLPFVDFRAPDVHWLNSLDEIFRIPLPYSPYSVWGPFGKEVGFDYGIALSIGEQNGAPKVRIQLLKAPDQTDPFPESVLDCVPVRKH